MTAVSTDTDAPTPPVDATDSLFHAPAWRAAVEESFGLEFRRFLPASEPTGSAWYSVVDDIRGRRIVSTPFSDFCEPNLATAEGWHEFTDHLRSYDCPVTIRPFANRHALADDTFERLGGLVWHGVDLRDGADGVFERMKSKVRTKIRRVPKQGVTFRASSDPADIATMHAMHVQLRKTKYGMLAQPKGFFDALAANFGDDMVVAFAEVDGEPIAGMTFFAHNGVWYYKFSASYPNDLRPNPALMMFAIRLADERGLHLVDFGRSDDDQPGLLAFKEQFEPFRLPLTTLRWAPDGHADPRGADVGAVLGALTTILTDPAVPDETTTAAGELLYRYFA